MNTLAATSPPHRAGLPRLVVAILIFGSQTDLAVSSDQLAANTIFGEQTVSQNVERVRTLTDDREPAERYRILEDWVLPSATHSSIRLNGRFLDRRHPEQGLYCPALELIEVANQLDELAALRRRVLSLNNHEDRDRQRAVSALLFLIDLKSSHNADSDAAGQLLKFLGEATIEQEWQLWPETVVCWVGLRDPQNWKLVAGLVTELYLRTIENKVSATDAWREEVAAMHGLLLHLQNGGAAASFTIPPELKHWIPADLVSHRDGDEPYPPAHWQWEEDSLRNLASGPQSLLFYKIPLSGNFEISCELPSLALEHLQIMYGDEFLFPDESRRSLHIGPTTESRGRSKPINPPLTKPHEWTWCRITVRDDVCSTFFNGRLVHRRLAHPGHAPWLAIRASSSLRHPAVRKLRIDGDPVIPSQVNLIGDRSLTGWRSPISSPGDFLKYWKFVRDERGTGLSSLPEADHSGSASESLMQYYRPLAEGESFEYEFFYSPGYQPAHPVIDDVTAIIGPQQLTLRKLTNENVSVEFFEHRGILKPDDWNQCRMEVQTHQVDFFLNGQSIHSFPLSADRSALMGLYRELDSRVIQVRNLFWRGRETSGFRSLESQFVNRVPRLRELNTTGFDLIEHDFTKEEFPTEYLEKTSRRELSETTPSSEGFPHAVASAADWRKSDLRSYISLQGDYEIVLEFDNLQISEEAHGGCGIVLNNEDGRMIQFTRRERSSNEHRVLLTLRSPLKNRKVMTAESLIASEATSGRFRVVREADTYHFSFADADSAVFRTVGEETIEGAGETADQFTIRMLAHRNTTTRVLWNQLRIASQRIDRSRFVAEGETVTEEQWTLIEKHKDTLQELVLDGTDVSDEDLARLKDHTGLKILWLKGTPVTSEGVRQLAKLTGLENLHLTATNVDDDISETVSNFKNLRRLGLSISRVGDRTVEAITRLPHLQALGLSRTSVTDESIDSLSRCASLRKLSLRNTSVTAAAVERLRQALPDCQVSY